MHEVRLSLVMESMRPLCWRIWTTCWCWCWCWLLLEGWSDVEEARDRKEVEVKVLLLEEEEKKKEREAARAMPTAAIVLLLLLLGSVQARITSIYIPLIG